MASDRDIDDAIDRAVRDIMGVEPRAGLRGRVLDRIERPSAGIFTLPRLAAATAVLVAAVIVSLVMRPGPDGVPPSQVAIHTVPAAVPDPPPAPEIAPTPRETAAPTARASADTPARNTRQSAPRDPGTAAPVDIRFPERGVVAAATVAGVIPDAGATTNVVPAPLDPDAEPIVIEAIRIEPLAIEPIVFGPIGSVH